MNLDEYGHVILPLGDPPRIEITANGDGGLPQLESQAMWCLSFYQASGELRIGERRFEIRPGCVSIVPPGPGTALDLRETMALTAVHFLPRSEGKGVAIPVVQDLGEDYVRYHDRIAEVLPDQAARPQRAAARLWDVLWMLADLQQGSQTAQAIHPAIRETMRLINQRLNDPPSAPELAKAVGLSHTHLNRLFQRSVKTSLTGYLQQQRMRLARHLLVHTSLSIGAISQQIGIDDPQVFNKMVRRYFGMPPREVRMRSLYTTPVQP